MDGNCPTFQLSSAQLSSAAGAVSSSQKCCNSRGSPKEAGFHRGQCKGFSCKTKEVLSNKNSQVQGGDGHEGPPHRSAHGLCMRVEKICKGCATPVSAQETFGQLNIKTMTFIAILMCPYVPLPFEQ